MRWLKAKYNNITVEVKATMAYMLCSILQKSLNFITLPIFTRLLTKEQYGQYSIYISWTSILMIFTTLNLAYGSFPVAMVKFKDRRAEYVSSIQSLCIVLTLFFLAVYLPFNDFFNNLFSLPTLLVVIMFIEILTTTFFQLWAGVEKFELRYKVVVAVTLIMSLGSVIMSYLFVVSSKEKGYAKIIGSAVIIIIIGIIIMTINYMRGKIFFHYSYWKYALGFNGPLVIYYLSQVIFNQSDKLMINYFCAEEKTAMYDVAYSLAVAFSFVLNAINSVYEPWLYEQITKKEYKKNQKITCAISIIMAILLLGVIWLAPEIIFIMAGKEYAEAVWVVPPVAASLLLLFYAQLFIDIQFYFEEKKKLILASVGAAVTNIVLNALLIPVFGFVCAAYTTLFSYIVFMLSNYFIVRMLRKRDNKIVEIYNVKYMIMTFALFLCLAMIGVALYKYEICRLGIICVVMLLAVMSRRKILEQMKKLMVIFS